ncbi:hypothetical protein [Actinacidiphila oryziradicis]|uniref:hypothetical protein n=1 Tax=Actinacidiphila oryziradicis TaxID=2571141 RepID=UPI0023F2C7EC|nr:hypothetical protein [Actinacidiphila oryziradicis]MCW2870100.1 hypothetical protein [Actinacidiphila oryziradicis]
MTDGTHRWLDTGSGPGAVVPTRIVTGEGASQTAYRKVLDHYDDCATCRDDAGGSARCEDGARLWQDYREARITP